MKKICATFVLPLSLLAYGPVSPRWYAVNDGVMGGLSRGGPVAEEGKLLVFTGEISLKNNGGFSSVRADSPAWAMEGRGTLVLRVRGDGRFYWMDLRTSTRQGAFSYRQAIQTVADTEITVRVPLEKFRASAFGRTLWIATPLDPSRVVSLGFTLYDKRDGPFRLEVLDIAYEPEGEP